MTTITKVQNYQGKNSFILKMKDAVSKYGKLTPAQSNAVDKILKAAEEAKKVELTEDEKKIQSYTGQNSFIKDLQSKLEKYGKLSEKQVSAALNQIQKEIDKENTIKLNVPAEGDTIIVGRRIGQKLKETYGLKFNPTLLDITKVLGISPKAVKFSGKMTVKRGDICVCCGKTLTDEFSMLTKMGKTCSKHMGVEYITDKSQADRFREEYLKRVEEIGEMEFWVPKSQIKKWEGTADILLKMF
jgi:predicted HicB family RNase H-like nuclease